MCQIFSIVDRVMTKEYSFQLERPLNKKMYGDFSTTYPSSSLPLTLKMDALKGFIKNQYAHAKKTSAKVITWVNDPNGIVAQVAFPLMKVAALGILLTLVIMSMPISIAYQLAILFFLTLTSILFSLDVAKSQPVQTTGNDSFNIKGNVNRACNFILKHVNPSGVAPTTEGSVKNLCNKIAKPIN